MFQFPPEGFKLILVGVRLKNTNIIPISPHLYVIAPFPRMKLEYDGRSKLVAMDNAFPISVTIF